MCCVHRELNLQYSIHLIYAFGFNVNVGLRKMLFYFAPLRQIYILYNIIFIFSCIKILFTIDNLNIFVLKRCI